MERLGKELGRYIAGDISLEELHAQVAAWLAANPAARNEAQAWLARGRESGRLSESTWAALRGLFVQPDENATRRRDTTLAAAPDPIPEAPAAAARASLQIGMTLKEGRFTLVQELGHGGMGAVYKASDRNKLEANDRKPYIALKVLSEEFARRPDAFIALQREARRAQELAHPNVIKVFDFDRDGQIAFMTMEFLEGAPLDRLLQTDYADGLPVVKAWPLIHGVGSALAAAHENKLVHSDIKPSNVFICSNSLAKVLDFGISRPLAIGEETGSTTLYDPGERIGALTPSYASLEQLKGERSSAQDDIYSFACVVYEVLTGAHPFARVSADHAESSGLVPRRIEGLSRRQWDAMRRALAFHCENRTKSINEFLRCFEPPSILRKHRVLIGAAAAAVLISSVSGGGLYFYDYMLDSFLRPSSRPSAAHRKLTPEQGHEVEDSMFLANESMRDARSATSPDQLSYLLSEGANNVNQILDSVLAVDPDNSQALQMKAEGADLYAKKARELRRDGNNGQAVAMIRFGRKMADNRDLYRMEQEMCQADTRLCQNNQN